MLTAIVSVAVFEMKLDAWAVVGIALIVAGVLVLNGMSGTLAHHAAEG